jgi:nucleoside-diphosphate-sugar epimerase
MTSSERGLKVLQTYGADGVVVDAFDAEAVNAAIGRVRPDAVIEELTSLPKDYTPQAMRAAAERDRKLRLEGGQNVHQAARTAGAKRYLVQSTGFFYGPGAGLASETDSLAVNASPGVSGSVRTYLEIEKRVLGSREMEGVALRYGFFYGPGTYHDPDTGSITRQVREQKYPVVGSGTAVYSFIQIEDAAAATVAALEGDPGVYNIVDDDPSEMRVWLPAFARSVGAPPPPHVTEQQVQALGPDVLYYATRLRGARNELAKRKLGFSPRRLEWLSKATMEFGAGPGG